MAPDWTTMSDEDFKESDRVELKENYITYRGKHLHNVIAAKDHRFIKKGSLLGFIHTKEGHYFVPYEDDPNFAYPVKGGLCVNYEHYQSHGIAMLVNGKIIDGTMESRENNSNGVIKKYLIKHLTKWLGLLSD